MYRSHIFSHNYNREECIELSDTTLIRCNGIQWLYLTGMVQLNLNFTHVCRHTRVLACLMHAKL